MDALDGNAIAGALASAFGVEVTTATGTCARCGTRSMVGEFAVYLSAPGVVVRCGSYDSVVMVLLKARGVTCVDLQGLEVLEPPVRGATTRWASS